MMELLITLSLSPVNSVRAHRECPFWTITFVLVLPIPKTSHIEGEICGFTCVIQGFHVGLLTGTLICNNPLSLYKGYSKYHPSLSGFNILCSQTCCRSRIGYTLNLHGVSPIWKLNVQVSTHVSHLYPFGRLDLPGELCKKPGLNP